MLATSCMKIKNNKNDVKGGVVMITLTKKGEALQVELQDNIKGGARGNCGYDACQNCGIRPGKKGEYNQLLNDSNYTHWYNIDNF